MDGTEYSNKRPPAIKDKAPTWLNDTAMSMLKEAVLAEKETVFLNGQEFTITYGFKNHFPSSGETTEHIRLNPVRGFVPMGYINVKKILAA
jgi:hypothetical protein